MRCVREKINGRGGNKVEFSGEQGSVPGESGGVAGYVDNAFRSEFQNTSDHFRSQAGARRITEDLTESGAARNSAEQAGRVAGRILCLYSHAFCVDAGAVDGVRGIFDARNGATMDAGEAGSSYTAIEIKKGCVQKIFSCQTGEYPGGFCIHLKEIRGVEEVGLISEGREEPRGFGDIPLARKGEAPHVSLPQKVSGLSLLVNHGVDDGEIREQGLSGFPQEGVFMVGTGARDEEHPDFFLSLVFEGKAGFSLAGNHTRAQLAETEESVPACILFLSAEAAEPGALLSWHGGHGNIGGETSRADAILYGFQNGGGGQVKKLAVGRLSDSVVHAAAHTEADTALLIASKGKFDLVAVSGRFRRGNKRPDGGVFEMSYAAQSVGEEAALPAALLPVGHAHEWAAAAFCGVGTGWRDGACGRLEQLCGSGLAERLFFSKDAGADLFSGKCSGDKGDRFSLNAFRDTPAVRAKACDAERHVFHSCSPSASGDGIVIPGWLIRIGGQQQYPEPDSVGTEQVWPYGRLR